VAFLEVSRTQGLDNSNSPRTQWVSAEQGEHLVLELAQVVASEANSSSNLQLEEACLVDNNKHRRAPLEEHQQALEVLEVKLAP